MLKDLEDNFSTEKCRNKELEPLKSTQGLLPTLCSLGLLIQAALSGIHCFFAFNLIWRYAYFGWTNQFKVTPASSKPWKNRRKIKSCILWDLNPLLFSTLSELIKPVLPQTAYIHFELRSQHTEIQRWLRTPHWWRKVGKDRRRKKPSTQRGFEHTTSWLQGTWSTTVIQPHLYLACARRRSYNHCSDSTFWLIVTMIVSPTFRNDLPTCLKQCSGNPVSRYDVRFNWTGLVRKSEIFCCRSLLFCKDFPQTV